MNGMFTCAAPSAINSLFNALANLEIAAARLPQTAEYAASVADRYLGPSATSVTVAPEDHEDQSVVSRLAALTRRIDNAASNIDFNLNRLSE